MVSIFVVSICILFMCVFLCKSHGDTGTSMAGNYIIWQLSADCALFYPVFASEPDHNPISQTIPKNCVPIIPWRTYTYLPSFTFIHSIHIHKWLAETILKCLSQPGTVAHHLLKHQGPLVRSSIVMSFTATGVSPRVLASQSLSRDFPSKMGVLWPFYENVGNPKMFSTTELLLSFTNSLSK